MKNRKLFAGFLAILAAILGLCTVLGAFFALNRGPLLIVASEGAIARGDELMKAISSGNFDSAAGMMYGSPCLGGTLEDDNATVNLIWDAFLNSFHYDFPGMCYASDSGVALDVHITCLDISSVTDAMRKHSQILLGQRVAQAEDMQKVYDEKNNYQEVFIQEILRDAAGLALNEDARMQDRIIPLHLIYDQDEWWVMPSEELLNVLSGAIVG